MRLPANAALILVDIQRAIDDPRWALAGPRNNTDAEANITRLLAVWRKSARPIFHIRHDSTSPESTYRPGQLGNDFKPEAFPLAGEAVIPKNAHSAFIGTDLEARLRAAAIDTVVVVGVVTNNSVETTVRNAADLGFAVFLAEDAVFTFARLDYRGRLRTAEDVHAMSLANLEGEYCAIVSSAEMSAAALLPEGQSQ